MRDDFIHCVRLVRELDRDRYLATLFAPEGKRDALFALYAFDAQVARVRDLAREPMPGEIRLQWWREVLLGERAGEAAAHPVASALLDVVARHKLAKEPLLGLIEAHRFDLYDEPMSSLAELEKYGSETAGVIFKTAARILADPGPAVIDLTKDAGQALTMANVLVSLPHHAAQHRLYVPLEILRQYNADPGDVYAMRATLALRAALADLRLRARRHLSYIAEAEIADAVWPAFLSLAPLRQWLLSMERSDYEPFRPPEVSLWRRQWRIWRAAKSLRRLNG